jgi:hypothetical protein
MSVNKISNLGELREALSFYEKVYNLDDGNKVVLEVFDDRDDLVELSPFSIEVVSFKQPDGSHQDEVRICQIKSMLKMNW